MNNIHLCQTFLFSNNNYYYSVSNCDPSFTFLPLPCHRVAFVVNRRNLNSGRRTDCWELRLALRVLGLTFAFRPDINFLTGHAGADHIVSGHFYNVLISALQARDRVGIILGQQLRGGPAIAGGVVRNGISLKWGSPSSGASQLTRMLSAEAYCTMICGAPGGFMAITWYWISSLPNRLFAVHV